MGCCNLRITSFIVASLNAVAYLVAIMWDIIMLNKEYESVTHKHSTIRFGVINTPENYDVHAEFILLIIFAVGFIFSLLFIKGLYQNRLGFMSPLVYLTGAVILFSITTIISVYNTYLLKADHYLYGIVFAFNFFLALGIFILFISPLFVTYRRMRSSSRSRILPTTREDKERPSCISE